MLDILFVYVCVYIYVCVCVKICWGGLEVSVGKVGEPLLQEFVFWCVCVGKTKLERTQSRFPGSKIASFLGVSGRRGTCS